ncbi:hypothetical protein UA08_01028 [Talaromyces atroroseus]|uniref:Altered inheritance of mitochondria protein 9, mitochondrial n=1 Tax=Talaromyces atroroseus TaxID=1441469 RepID=A0A225BDW9_TALAT|nr:hypothetical protein UA08_01028 [Talaromyces atroroseus]OKL64217.1 hypothetical protein UA08_01028 [Talaromyces atroroseus]
MAVRDYLVSSLNPVYWEIFRLNEEAELSKRYVNFYLRQLIAIAVGVSDGAQYWSNNKAFILITDNGTEVFTKLPNPNAGPPKYTPASEVATRKLLREVFNIPVPRVFAWSANAASNPVEVEYIIEERAPGVRLGYAEDLNIESTIPEALEPLPIGPLTSAELWVRRARAM